ncbi:hypothetical protein D8674_016138 [Pyrus ussuriensis x Pyrus communis]|uniref:Remorin C-terminal domain-containing protein n=1 Tax=Pyrus ussuriensis x Pyrus communis TaxID=2448454 RepID=A0A5N5HA59_9ROSA|nr:hypothetical protein D8674_016138 [Pyrus ussuriensis x Pyrus communis]
MSQDYDANRAIEHATAVAAAAFAIKSTEDSALSDEEMTGNERKPTLVRITSGKEETAISKPEPGRFSKIFSGAGSRKSTPAREDPDGKVPITIATTGEKPEKAVLPDRIKPQTAPPPPPPPPLQPPSIKRTPTFDDKRSSSAGGVKPETAAPKPNFSATTKSESPWDETKKPTSTGPGIRKTQADIWEETKIARLKARYETQKATILEWENKKKKKCRNHLDKKQQSEVAEKREKALRKFAAEMEYIKEIAEGARAQAEERHRNGVLKVKQKAKEMRRTGKAPKTCFCF